MRPAIWLAASLSAGIMVAEWLRPHPLLALAAIVLCMVWVLLARKRLPAALLVLVALVGAVWYSYLQTAGRGDLSAWYGRSVSITATIISEPELASGKGMAFIAEVERVDGRSAAGRVHIQSGERLAPAFGNRIHLRGVLREPGGPRHPGGFDQAAYLERLGVFSVIQTGEVEAVGPGQVNLLLRAALRARLAMEGVLQRILPREDAALMSGLLLGSRSDLPDAVKESFRASGVFHLLAVSGGNIAMVLAPLLWLFRRLGLSQRMAAVSALPVLCAFIFITGATPSVLRAGLMAALFLLGEALGRERDGLNALGVSILLLLLWSPRLLFDVGFQLSVAATLGIMLFAQSLGTTLSKTLTPKLGKRVGEWTATGLAVTLAAQVLVEPISLHNFGTLSTVAPLANLMVLVIVEVVTAVGWVAMLLGFVASLLALPLAWVARLGLLLLLVIVKGTSAIPGAYLEPGRLPTPWVLVWYLIVVLIAFPVVRSRLVQAGQTALDRLRPHFAVAATALGLILVVGLFTWRQAAANPPDRLTVTVLDVGQGDAILVEAPGGRAMLVDAGPSYPADPVANRPGFDAGSEVVLPYLRERGVKRLDYVVLTHPHQDHTGGLPAVLSELPVGTFLDTGLDHEGDTYHRTLQIAQQKRIPVIRPVRGDRLSLGPVQVEVLFPEAKPLHGTRSDENSNSIVLRLRHRSITILLAGDMEAVTEELVLDSGSLVRADVLKVAHHGSKYSSTEPFLQAVKPRWAIISAGQGNLFGHPDLDTIGRLQEAGATVFRTDRHGMITIQSDGQQVTVRGERGERTTGRAPVGIYGRRWLYAW